MLFCTNQSLFRDPLHLHCPHYFHSIARLLRTERLLPDPPLERHIPYNIGHVTSARPPTRVWDDDMHRRRATFDRC